MIMQQTDVEALQRRVKQTRMQQNSKQKMAHAELVLLLLPSGDSIFKTLEGTLEGKKLRET